MTDDRAATLFRDSAVAAVHVCDARFVWLTLTVVLMTVVAECAGFERALPRPPGHHDGRSPRRRYAPAAADTWISPSTRKNTNSNVHKTGRNVSGKSTGGEKKADAERYKNGKRVKEEKSTKYEEEKGNGDEYNDKGGDGAHGHVHKGTKKKAAYKDGGKAKRFKTKKGFRDKYRKNENHKVNEFWDNYETYGTFKKIGKKSDLKLEGFKKNKKNQAKKGKKSKKENKKKGDTQKRSGSKGETGYNKEKESGSHHEHESEYHKEKKSKKRHKTKT